MRNHIPNLITLLNLLSGCIAITQAFQGNVTGAVAFVYVAALLDFLDGLAARLLNAYSPLGKELDSLADVVSFGVAPASALFVLIRDHLYFPQVLEPVQHIIPYLAFLIPLFSAYRLAKFNIDERQSRSFLGLPTPASGLFWISYCYAIHAQGANHEGLFFLSVILLFILPPLMTSNVPMFSLKVSRVGLKGNERQAGLVALSIFFVAMWGITGVAISIIAYIFLSLLPSKKSH